MSRTRARRDRDARLRQPSSPGTRQSARPSAVSSLLQPDTTGGPEPRLSGDRLQRLVGRSASHVARKAGDPPRFFESFGKKMGMSVPWRTGLSLVPLSSPSLVVIAEFLARGCEVRSPNDCDSYRQDEKALGASCFEEAEPKVVVAPEEQNHGAQEERDDSLLSQSRRTHGFILASPTATCTMAASSGLSPDIQSTSSSWPNERSEARTPSHVGAKALLGWSAEPGLNLLFSLQEHPPMSLQILGSIAPARKALFDL